MALYTKQLQQLYVAYFGRPADKSGLDFWEGVVVAQKGNTALVAAEFAKQNEYKTMYAGMSQEQIVNQVYNNLFNHDADEGGLLFWVDKLKKGIVTIDTVVTSVAAGAQGSDKVAFDNKVAAATAFTNALDTTKEIVEYASNPAANNIGRAFIKGVSDNDSLAIAIDPANLNTVIESIWAGSVAELTTKVDKITAGTINAIPQYTPGGNDLVNTLQSEDILTGANSAEGADDTLNATLGNSNDASETLISPVLNGIEVVNLQVTGDNLQGMNFQDATGVEQVNITRITANNAAFKVEDLASSTTSVSVVNATRAGSVEFLYREDELTKTDETLNVKIGNTRLNALVLSETGDTGEDQGYFFETVNVTNERTSNIDNLFIQSNAREDNSAANANQTVNIVANGALEVNNLNANGAEFINLTANADVIIAADELKTLTGANDGITTGDLRNLTITGGANVTIDGLDGHINEQDGGKRNGDNGTTLVVNAAAMSGNLHLGLQAGSDANSSGDWAFRADKDVSVTSGSGNDIIETYNALAGDISTGAGNDQVLINNGAVTPTWTNVEGVSTIDTGTGNDTVSAADLLATSPDSADGNTSFGQVTAAVVRTGDGNDNITVGNLASETDWNHGVLTDNNADDRRFIKGASVDAGNGDDTIAFATVAEGASVNAGAGKDTVNVDLNGGTILAGDTNANRSSLGGGGNQTNEVALDGTVDRLGAIVELGDGDDTINFVDAVSKAAAATILVATDAELRGGAGADVLNVVALDAVTVTTNTSAGDTDPGTNGTQTDVNANITGIETANFTVANQIDLASATVTANVENDDVETDGSITADILRFDSALTTINLESKEAPLLQTASTEIYEAGEATAFTLNNLRSSIALNLKAQEATGVNAGKLQDDEAIDVNLAVNLDNGRLTNDTFTLNVAQGSGAFDLNLTVGAGLTDQVGKDGSTTDDDDRQVENVVVNLAADDKGHRVNFNGWGDASHTEALVEGSRDVATSLKINGGVAGTTLVLENISADKIEATGPAHVKLTTTGTNNFTIATGAGNDVINMFSDDVRANDLNDDGDADSVDTTDEADAVNAGAGTDRLIINGNDTLGTFSALGGKTDDDVFTKLVSIENLEIQGGGANSVILDEAAATAGTNLQNIYLTGAGAQTTTIQIGENFVNDNGAGVKDTLNISSMTNLSGDKGAAAKTGPVTLIIDNQDTDQDTNVVNLNVAVGMAAGATVNFFNTGDARATVNVTATVAGDAVANSVQQGVGAPAAGQLNLNVTTGEIDKVTLLDNTAGNENGKITVVMDNSWAKTTFELDASNIANNDAAAETEALAGNTQTAGIQAGDTGGLDFNGAAETDAKLIVRGTVNDDKIVGSNQADNLVGNAGDDILQGGLGADTLDGGDGNDDIEGGVGNDSINAGAGNDAIYGEVGADNIVTGAGNDTIEYYAVTESNGDGADTITDFASGTDKIIVSGVVAGNGDANFINLASFATVPSAGDGDNSLLGNTGGEAFAVRGDAYYATDSKQLVIDVDGNGDITTGADLVIRSDAAINASDINYRIDAGANADFIRGGQGADTLDGGAGADTFVLVGSLSAADASSYAAAYQAANQAAGGGNAGATAGATAVLGATLFGVQDKILRATELLNSRSANEVNAGDEINSINGADAADVAHVFGTANLTLINAGGALNVGTLVVHSTVTITDVQLAALTTLVIQGNNPHNIIVTNTNGTPDTAAAVLAKAVVFAQGPLSTISITGTDGVVTFAWDAVDGRMEVVSSTATSVVAAAGTPIAGLGGAQDLSNGTYAAAAVLFSLGQSGYTITDSAAAIAAGTTAVLNAAASITLSAGVVAAADLNTADGKTSVPINGTNVTSITGLAADASTALASTGLTNLATKPVTLTDVVLGAAVLNTLDGQTTGAINAATVTTLTGTAAAVAAAFASTGITGLGNEAVTLSDTTLAAADLNAIDAATTGIVDASTVTTVTGAAAAVDAAYTSAGITGLGNEAVTLSDTTVAAATLNTLDTRTTGVVNAGTVTTLTGSIAAVTTAIQAAGLSGLGNEAVTLDDTTATAAALNTLDGLTTGVINAATVTTVTGSTAAATTALGSAGFSGFGNEAVVIDDVTLGAGALNALNALTTGVVNAATVTTLTGTSVELAAAYTAGIAGEISGLNNEAVTVTNASVLAADFNVVDAATSGAIDATAVTTITGTAAAANTTYASGATGLGDEAVVLTDTTLAAATVNTLDASTTGAINAGTVTLVTGSAAAVNTAVTSGGITGLNTKAVTLDDVTLAAAVLTTLDGNTTGVVNAGTVTTLTGTQAEIAAAYAANTGGTVSGLGNENVTISDAALSAALLAATDALTTGTVNAATVTTVTGTAAQVSAAYALGVAGTTSNLGDEAVTLSDTTLAATALTAVDASTTGVVNAATVTTLTGTLAEVQAAYDANTAGTVAGLGDEAVTLSGASYTVAQMNAFNANTTGTITYTATVLATTAADVFNVDAGFNAGNHTVKYTNGNQASAAAFNDVAGAALADTDTFTLSGAIDVLTFSDGDVLDLSSFGLLTQSSDAQFGATGSKVGDAEYKLVTGTYAAGTFTANAAGADLLVVWDANATTSVSQVAVVVTGVSTLDVGTELLLA